MSLLRVKRKFDFNLTNLIASNAGGSRKPLGPMICSAGLNRFFVCFTKIDEIDMSAFALKDCIFINLTVEHRRQHAFPDNNCDTGDANQSYQCCSSSSIEDQLLGGRFHDDEIFIYSSDGSSSSKQGHP